uniref:DDE Tnp4 domain-containing protein n=1 Tax=Spongospora subterranea TaxID=70186 RepID=A0A0H5RAV3_9EUKA|eukprot:CRZ10926.1 hypothetical protein [Spongospora subterranea]
MSMETRQISGQYQFGDSGYRLTKYKITPSKQPAAMRPENEEFNLRLSRGRVVSEHGNAVLKARWQSLARFAHLPQQGTPCAVRLRLDCGLLCAPQHCKPITAT